jgi:putative two-component system response regulator
MVYWLPGEGGGEAARILIADDDAASRALLRALLERTGAQVTEAHDGPSTLSELERQAPQLLLLDVNMPPPDGIEVTRLLRLRKTEAELPIILVTGQSDTASKVAGLEAGATDFVAKPFEPSELIARVRVALRMRLAFDRLESVQSVLASLASAVDAKDPSTEHHCSRLAETSLELAKAAGIDGELVEAIGYGAVLHEVGKIGVSEAVIRKKGRLDEHEWAQMRRHPLIGAGIVEPLRLGRLVAPIVRGHHEHWNGRGYPDGLRGEQIPVGARIVTIVDAFDAMTNDRPYRAAMSQDEAREELARQAGVQFDPQLTRVFLEEVLGTGEARSVAAQLDLALTRGLIEEPVGR